MWTDKYKINPEKLGEWLRGFDWEQTREKVSQESRARIILLGLKGAGKSSLFNRLCGWTISTPGPAAHAEALAEAVEDYGLFCLADLPHDLGPHSQAGLYDLPRPFGPLNGQEWPAYDDFEGLGRLPLGALDPLELAEAADLLLYVLDGAEEVRAADYRWVGRLRRLGRPLLVLLNKSDLIEADLAGRQAEIEARLAASVLPVSALTGAGLADQLLPKMANLCPELTVALGRQLGVFRRQAAARLIRQAAIINGLVALEPLPLIDLPVQAITLMGLMLRIAAIYDRPPSSVRRREVITAVTGGLAGRYGAQQLAKLAPGVGWLISSLIGWSCTWGLGRAAVAYFEAGGDETVERGWRRTRIGVTDICRAIHRRWQGRPRLRLSWGQADRPLLESEEKSMEG
jgi:uncharacterized protein (DUF697 family)/GTP-binding protein EngB required for normal cell division